MRYVLVTIALLCCSPLRAVDQTGAPIFAEGVISVMAHGAKADGKTDDSAAIQAALDAAGKKDGGTVYLPPGRYAVRKSISIPQGITLAGANQTTQYMDKQTGTLIYSFWGRDAESGPALFELTSASTVKGITVYYPEQNSHEIHPYSWTFHLQGGDATLRNITLINSYNAISVGPEPNVRHHIRDIYGCALRRGLSIDGCTDTGRVENVHWHNHWWWSSVFGSDDGGTAAGKYINENLEAFIFGQTDWEHVSNTTIWPAKIGYHFIRTPRGAFSGELHSIFGDNTAQAIVVDALAGEVNITNGTFVAVAGPAPYGVLVNDAGGCSLRFSNCSFGPAPIHAVHIRKGGFISFNNCVFNAGSPGPDGGAVILVEGGRLQVQGCSFRVGSKDQPCVEVKKGTQYAIITGNDGANGVWIKNDPGMFGVASNNELGR